jgi:hypothetical protein
VHDAWEWVLVLGVGLVGVSSSGKYECSLAVFDPRGEERGEQSSEEEPGEKGEAIFAKSGALSRG